MKTKDRIVAASIELFNTHGERAITTNHIASYLNISPGNLYYHFKNKEDILKSIFALYRTHLLTRFQPLDSTQDIFEQLDGYLQAVLELMRTFHFFYDNQADILARDVQLKAEYVEVQEQLQRQMEEVLEGMRDQELIEIDNSDIPGLAQLIKMTISFWTPFIKSRNITGELDEEALAIGVARMVQLVKAYARGEGKQKIAALEQKYTAKNDVEADNI